MIVFSRFKLDSLDGTEFRTATHSVPCALNNECFSNVSDSSSLPILKLNTQYWVVSQVSLKFM